MVQRLLRECLLGAALLLAPGRGAAQIVVGKVLDDITGRPLPTTAVMLLDTADVAVGYAESDSLGSFAVQVPHPGRYRFFAQRLAYGTLRSPLLSLGGERSAEIELRMVPAPVEMPALTISVDRWRADLTENGFYKRRDRSMGYFLDEAQIREDGSHRVSSLLWNVPGVWMRPLPSGLGYVATLRRGRGVCPMKVVLDDVKLELDEGFTIDDFVTLGEVIGIEVYPGGVGAPVKHRGPDAFCGIIMIWTR